MKIILRLFLYAVAVFIAAYILPGVHVTGGWQTYLVLAVVLAVINMVVKPVLAILTLPLTIITLGLFSLVLNAFLVLLAEKLVPGFTVDSFLYALAFGLVFAVVNWVLKRFDD